MIQMAKRKSRKKAKRTITPEHLAKMQEGRVRAKKHKERVAMAENIAKKTPIKQIKTEKLLKSVRRNG